MSLHPASRVVAALLSFAFAACADAASGLFELEWRELAPGVHVGQRPDPMRYPVVCNTLIVIGDDGVLVFDGGGFAAQGEQVRDKVKALTSKPVRYIVVSHWHGDHNRGLGPLLDAFPKAQVISHAFTRAAILGAPMQKIHKAELEGAVTGTADAIEKGLAENKFMDGSPLAPEERAYFERFIVDNKDHAAEVKRMRITVPTKTFEDRLDIDLGRRLVQLRHFGPANTKGDAVMILPAERIVAAGDMVVDPIPYGFGSYPASWANALRQIKSTGYATLVSGHGALQTDTAYVDLLIETLELVARQVEKAVAEGKSLDETRAAVDFDAVERRFTKGDPILTRFFGFYFKRPIVQAAFNVAKGIENEKLAEDPPKEK